jgi:regulator of replication initiation timing
VSEQPLETRIGQLEKIVATQSEMILKLVEMMNHLGTENASLSERIEASRAATAQQLEKVAELTQRLVGQFSPADNPESN